MSRNHYNIEVFRDAERHTQPGGLEPRSGVPYHLPESRRDDRFDGKAYRPRVSRFWGWVGSTRKRRDPAGKAFEPLHAKYTVGDPIASASCNRGAVSPVIRRLGTGRLL
jgi:hypothetical protein